MTQLTPELISAIKEKLPMERFVPSEKVIAQHELFNQFKVDYPNLPKLVFYICMDEIFGVCHEKDEQNDLGRKIQYVSPTKKPQ